MKCEIRISMPCNATEGMVFAKIKNGEAWERVSASKVSPSRVIRCHDCDEPAVQVDHFWPYYTDDNKCSKHLEATP